MYLPPEICKANVLITVKTYPNPSNKYQEIVCTAGFLETGEWIRIYPVPFRRLPLEQQYRKYEWIQLDLVKTYGHDFRPESYRPKRNLEEEIAVGDFISSKHWYQRKQIVLKNVYTSMSNLIEDSRSPKNYSLAVFKPSEMIDFVIEHETEPEWTTEETSHLKQMNLFETSPKGYRDVRVVRKLPYKYYYKFLSKGDQNPRRLQIFDWEIGALYWNCLKRERGDETAANEKVKLKYWDEFVNKKELYLYLGTTLEFHRRRMNNPFTIIGVFPPPKDVPPPKMEAEQQSLFN